MTLIGPARLRRAIITFTATASGFFFLIIQAAYPQGSMNASQRQGPPALEGVPRLGHVFVIIGENTTYDHLTSTNAPYLTQTFRPQAAWFTEYYGATHW